MQTELKSEIEAKEANCIAGGTVILIRRQSNEQAAANAFEATLPLSTPIRMPAKENMSRLQSSKAWQSSLRIKVRGKTRFPGISGHGKRKEDVLLPRERSNKVSTDIQQPCAQMRPSLSYETRKSQSIPDDEICLRQPDRSEGRISFYHH